MLEDDETHPLIAIALFVVAFLAIHPFQDGNGRLALALTTVLLLRAGYTYVAYSSLESVIERSMERHNVALRKTQSTLGTDTVDWEPWLHCSQSAATSRATVRAAARGTR